MSLMISVEITLKCNSRWEQVSGKGVECCQSKFTSTFHLQPEHWDARFEDYFIELIGEARSIGWKGEDDRIYCPECDEVNQHFSEELSSLSVSIN